MTHWRHAEATDTGLVRQSNQDAVYVDDSLAIVADGMGGHAAGEVASEMTIEMLHAGFVELADGEKAIRGASELPAARGPGNRLERTSDRRRRLARQAVAVDPDAPPRERSVDRKSTRLNSSHWITSRMPSSA